MSVRVTDSDNGELSRPAPSDLPVLPLRNAVVFPNSLVPLVVGLPHSVKLIEEAMSNNGLIAVCASRDPSVENPLPGQVYEVGTICRIRSAVPLPEDSLQVVVQGLQRCRVDHWLSTEPYLRAQILESPEKVDQDVETAALTRSLHELLNEILSFLPDIPKEAGGFLNQIEDPRYLVYMTAAVAHLDVTDGQRILEMDTIKEKLSSLITHLTREREVLTLDRKIRSDASERIDKQQREFMLREQLKSIQLELGESDEVGSTAKEYANKLANADLPDEARQEAGRELKRLASMSPQSPEFALIRTYLDWVIELPWRKLSEDCQDIPSARKVLNEDHYDMEDVKDRILEFLAVRIRLNQHVDKPAVSAVHAETTGSILCFTGPPGVGKTSLGRSIARALGRQFTHMSLGGIRDEAELRGHRRTYIGAMPGRIIQAIKRTGTRNPVFMLDEIDKVGTDWRGDPASALLEILDPAQNYAFRDHYLDLDFDLSDVLFITTANELGLISPPLRDRMEVLSLQGYTEEEKVNIASRYLLPRQMAANGLTKDEISFDDGTLPIIVRDYTREAGVRNLERNIGTLCRKAVIHISEHECTQFVVTTDAVHDILRKERYEPERSETAEIPGIATGLSVSAYGGEILFIEATGMQGNGHLTLTGQLGDVMKESANIALSYVRSQAKLLRIDPVRFKKTDVHLHVPAGAIPKDGPSAGIAMVMAITSLFTEHPVNGCVGMTGEITLRGRVMPVGGIKMKILAAHRAGLTDIILPKRNERDLADIPESTRKAMTFHLVDRIEEALRIGISAIQPATRSAQEPPTPRNT